MVVGCVHFLFPTECVGMMRKLFVLFFPSVRPSFHRCLFRNVGSEKTKCKYLCEFDTV